MDRLLEAALGLAVMDASLDSPERYTDIRSIIDRKPGLRALYEDFYARFSDAIEDCPHDGQILELGSGAGFLKEYLPEATTSDILPYAGVDAVVDATHMPFAPDSLKAILMLNVFHHIANVERLFEEAARCLKPGGKMVIIDQYPGWIAKPLLKYLHHEGFDDQRKEWSFPSTGPLSGANGALAWNVFFRDELEFTRKFPMFAVTKRETHTPLRYWLSGGLKKWTLLPKSLFRLASKLDGFLVRLTPELGSFVEIELTKR